MEEDYANNFRFVLHLGVFVLNSRCRTEKNVVVQTFIGRWTEAKALNKFIA